VRARFDQPLSRTSIGWIGVAAAGLLAAMPLAYQMPSAREVGRYASALPGAEQVKNLAGMLDARSPGERLKGELTKTKRNGARSQVAHLLGMAKTGANAKRRTSSKIVPVSEPFATPELLLPLVAPLELAAPVDLLEPGLLDRAGNAAPTTGVIGPIGGVLVATGGSGGGGSPGAGSPGGGKGPGVGDKGGGSVIPTSPSIAAVPEPATWAMMLVGFGFIGFVMRRRRPASSKSMAWSGR
jgi:hypothetical protein